MVNPIWKKAFFPLAAGALSGSLYIFNNKKKSVEEVTLSKQFKKWDYNWDKRDISSVLKQPRPKNEDEDSLNKKVKKLTSTATRHIFIVRHSQYYEPEGNLTPLGLEQADLVGRYLKQLDLPYTKVVHSTMPRAIETAQAILKHLPSTLTPAERSEILNEGYPIPSEPPVGTWRQEYKYFTDGPRVEAAFRKFFHRAPPEQKEDSYEIIVCHANVIRYFICRLLQVPPEAWFRFMLQHCSVTCAIICPDGEVVLSMVGNAGFLPKDKLTMSYVSKNKPNPYS